MAKFGKTALKLAYNATIIACLLATTGCVEKIAQSRVRTALIDAGLSEQLSQCMAHRMVSELTIKQLRKMEALKGPKKTAFEYIAAVQKMNEPEVVRVTAASAAVCASGFGR
ncbi:MAG: hypothetical protein RLY97_1865 [Pseudomonadota bacterium]